MSMDIQLFQFDSIDEQGSIPLASLKDSAPIDLIELKLFSAKNETFSTISEQNSQIDSFQSNSFSFDKIEGPQKENHSVKYNLDFNKCQNKQNNKKQRKTKNSKIQKNALLTEKQSSKAIQTKNLEPNDRKMKSKYNNMGGFLIGTISQILNARGRCRLNGDKYQVQIDQTWILIQNYQFSDKLGLEKNMEILKNKISCLPRKQGAKKHIFKLINTESEDTEEIKICKHLMRKQIVYSLSQLQWLRNHVKSRDFKPENDDFLGTKKFERHQDYLNYLRGIKENLVKKNCIPKRINIIK